MNYQLLVAMDLILAAIIVGSTFRFLMQLLPNDARRSGRVERIVVSYMDKCNLFYGPCTIGAAGIAASFLAYYNMVVAAAVMIICSGLIVYTVYRIYRRQRPKASVRVA